MGLVHQYFALFNTNVLSTIDPADKMAHVTSLSMLLLNVKWPKEITLQAEKYSYNVFVTVYDQ